MSRDGDYCQQLLGLLHGSGWLLHTTYAHDLHKNFKGKVAKAATTTATTTSAPETFLKRRKVSAAGFFGEESDDEAPDGDAAILEELEEYLALPQIKIKTDFGVQEWWRNNVSKFPNLEVMARQYLGCPSTSACVERLFSTVGIAFSAKQKSSSPAVISDRMFAHANLP